MRDLEFDIRGRDRSKPAFDSAEARARGFNGVLDQTARGFNLAATAAKAFAVGFTLTAVSNFGSVVRQTITDAADLVDMADKVGVSVENVQRLTYGFELAGVAAGDVDQILTQWSKRIGEAHTAGGRLSETFKANGISLTDVNGRLRSSVDLMRDYANLIANAGSDQERMTLATMGFGKAGDVMVLALRDGAEGLDKLMRAADEAGGVLDEEILRRAADIDDEFNRLWRTFETASKRAILNAVGWLADLQGSFADFEKRRNAFLAGAEIGRMAGMPRPDRGGRLESPIDRRIAAALRGDAQPENPELVRMLRDRFGDRTVIPGGSTGGARAAREQESAYERVIARLNEERTMLGLNATEQRILAEQRRAGVAATSEQGLAIRQVVEHIDQETARLRALEEQQRAFVAGAEFIGQAGLDAFDAWITGADKAGDALKRLGSQILRTAADALLFNRGPLAGLLGGGGSGALPGFLSGLLGGGFTPNTTFSAFLGYRANGGPVDPFGSYIVGERGPEILRMGGRGGHVISNDNAFGGGGISVPVSVAIDATGADAAGLARVEREIASLKADLPGRVIAAVTDARRRGAKI